VLAFLIEVGCTQEVSYAPVYRNLTEAVYASGVLKPEKELDIIPSVAGIVTTVYAQEGDTVEAGQILVSLRADSPILTAKALEQELMQAQFNASTTGPLLRSIETEWLNAREKYRLDSTEYKRIERLANQGAATSRQLDQAKTAAEMSRGASYAAQLRFVTQKKQLASIAEALANQLKALRSTVDDYFIRSPIQARVLSIDVQHGDWVSPPKPVIKLGSLGPMRAEVEIDEADAIRMRTGLKVLIKPEGHTGKPLIGVVSRIDPAIDPTTRTLKIHVVPEQPLYFAGLSLEANVIVKEHGKVLAVPRSCLLAGDSLIIDCGQGKRRIAVETGVKDMNFVQIISKVDTSCRLFLPQ
jgi:multidrug efflux pump subunit AcrA (membrane-fusion protein)